jgi:sensor histidine kinase YesM
MLAGVMTLAVSSALKITGDYLVGQRRRRELERQQLLTELAMLKMQVNPHFLFNTLNNIYSLASLKSDRAPEAILRLADLMRYLLHDSAADTVLLAQELQHLRNFLELQRLRLPSTGAAALLLDTDGIDPAQSLPIAPMLLLPLVENAFKHGDLTARPAVSIQLSQQPDGSLHFVVDNAVDPTAASPALEQPGGVGLSNLRRRLALLYPGRHHLHIDATPTHHHAALTLLPAAPAQ